jgi:hypothetical protein
VKILWRVGYYLFIIPMGFFSRLLGRDRLGLAFDRNKASYRKARKPSSEGEGTPDSEENCPDTMYPMW